TAGLIGGRVHPCESIIEPSDLIRCAECAKKIPIRFAFANYQLMIVSKAYLIFSSHLISPTRELERYSRGANFRIRGLLSLSRSSRQNAMSSTLSAAASKKF